MANVRLKFSQDVELNHVREKVKTRYKLQYKVLKEEDGHYLLLYIYPYPILIQLKDFILWIHDCVIVVGTFIFESNFPFTLPLTKENLEYCCLNENNNNKKNEWIQISIEINQVFTKYNNKSVIHK